MFVELFSYDQQLIEQGRFEGLAEGRSEGLAEGRSEGLAEGRSEGRSEERIAIAKSMISDNFLLSAISKHTGLSVQEVEELKAANQD